MRVRPHRFVVASLGVALVGGAGLLQHASADESASSMAASVIQGSGASRKVVAPGGGGVDGPVEFVGVLRDGTTGRPLIDQPAVLQARAGGAAEWSTFRAIRGATNGVLHVPYTGLSFSSEFRWSYAGSGTATPAVGPSFKVAVRPRLNLCCGGEIKLGRSHKMNAIVSHAASGLKAVLQLRSGTSWSTVSTCTTNAHGVCPLSVKPTKTGTFTYRIHHPEDAKLAAAVSGPETLKVTK